MVRTHGSHMQKILEAKEVASKTTSYKKNKQTNRRKASKEQP